MSDTIQGVIADLEAIDAQQDEDMAAMTVALARSQAALRECEAGKPPVIPPVLPPDPPIIVPPDPPTKPPTQPPTGERPGEDLDWAIRTKPTLEDCDWVIEGNLATSKRGLRNYSLSANGPDSGIGGAYRASRASGVTGSVVFGIVDDAGAARVGGMYNKDTWPSHLDLTWVDEAKASATFVGLSDTASVGLVFAASLGRATPTGDVQCFDIGVRGVSDSFVLRANNGSDHVQFDGCWWLMEHGRTEDYTSGLHIDDWGTLVIKDHKWRGETPGSPGLRFREHPLCYLKAGRTSTLIQGSNLYGGNRCGFQKRPQNGHQPLAADRLMARGNHCTNYGDNWDPGNPATSDGGGVYTTWLTNGGGYFYDNEAVNFRYAGLVISPQFGDRNYNFLTSGNQHDTLYISGNRLTPGPITERGTVTISAADNVRLYSDNEFAGKVTLNSQTAYRYSPMLRNGRVEIWVPEGDPVPTWDLWTYDIPLGKERRMTEAEVAAMVVRYTA